MTAKSEGFDAAAIVVGGGPAGLFLVARLAAAGVGPVVLLEKGPRPGRKLLASGAGQCNITHSGEIADFLGRYGDKGRFLKKALYGFTNLELEAWFSERGVAFEAEEGGKVFPSSRRASEVLGALVAECGRQGVEVRCRCGALSVSKVDGGFELELGVDTEGGAGATGQIAATGQVGATGGGSPVDEAGARSFLRSPFLAIATGGMSYPLTGSTGDGYRLAASLGHRLVRPRPALSPALIKDFPLASLAGIGFEDLRLVQRRAGRKVGEARGDILITHEGLSGPGLLDASRGISPGDVLELEFCKMGLAEFRDDLDGRCRAAPRSLVKNALADAGMPRRMAELFCSMVGLEEGATCASLRREARDALAGLASAFPAEVAALGGFDKAMVTAGGVSLDEVDGATMGSRLVPGLYFAGEVLDYDGDTGGFNLQAAFSTAAAAAKAIASAIRNLGAGGA